MGTKSVTVFRGQFAKAEAKVVREMEGYPARAGNDLMTFLALGKGLSEESWEYGNASVVAASYVVFLAGVFAKAGGSSALEFRKQVGIVQRLPQDTWYVYEVFCDEIREDGMPHVTVGEFWPRGDAQGLVRNKMDLREVLRGGGDGTDRGNVARQSSESVWK